MSDAGEFECSQPTGLADISGESSFMSVVQTWSAFSLNHLL